MKPNIRNLKRRLRLSILLNSEFPDIGKNKSMFTFGMTKTYTVPNSLFIPLIGERIRTLLERIPN